MDDVFQLPWKTITIFRAINDISPGVLDGQVGLARQIIATLLMIDGEAPQYRCAVESLLDGKLQKRELTKRIWFQGRMATTKTKEHSVSKTMTNAGNDERH